MDKDISALLRAVKKAGWRVVEGRHYKCYSPDGQHIVTVSKAPSSRHAIKAIRADFRRAGLDLDGEI